MTFEFTRNESHLRKVGYIQRQLQVAYYRALAYTKRDQQDLPYRWAYFRLVKYIRSFLRGTGKNRLIMVPGLRGTGKTTLLWQLYRYLVEEEKIPHKYVLFLPVDELRTLIGSNIYEAVSYYEELLGMRLEELRAPVFIFLDEVTYDPNWPSAVKAIYDRTPMAFIVISGSSALALKTTPDLARRGVREILYPLSMAEYIMLKYGKYLRRDFIGELKRAIFESTSPDRILQRLDELYRELAGLGIDLRVITTQYLKLGGLPFAISNEQEKIYEQVFDVIERVINKDFAILYDMSEETREKATMILAGISTNPPGPIAISNIARDMGMKYEVARRIFHAFEQSLILYSIPPHAKGMAQIRKAYKYCFTTPTIRAALAYRLGWSPDDLLGHMLEDAVLSTLVKLKTIHPKIVGIHYDPKKNNVDAIIEIRTIKGTISIPIETGWGYKEERQIKKAIKRLNSPYGIIIDNTPKPEQNKNIIHIPKHMFLLM